MKRRSIETRRIPADIERAAAGWKKGKMLGALHAVIFGRNG